MEEQEEWKLFKKLKEKKKIQARGARLQKFLKEKEQIN